MLTTYLPDSARLMADSLIRRTGLLTLRAAVGGCDHWQPDRRTPTWFVCGDETTHPWADALSCLAEDAFVEDCTLPGASGKRFVAEKRLNFVELCLRKGDKLLVQFGRADQHKDVRVSTAARAIFPLYLNMMIDAARRQGAEPVLVTPIGAADGEYAAAMRDLAQERGVRLLDMAETLPAGEGDGCDQAVWQACWVLAATGGKTC